MKMALNFAILVALVNEPCLAQTLPVGKNEVVFAYCFREYGWRSHDSKGNKFDRPLQIIVDMYEVNYRLTLDSLLIFKRLYSHRERPTTVYQQALSKADSQLVVQLLAATKPETLGRITADNGLPDHGLDATVILGGRSTHFMVYKEPTILSLLSIVDRLVPVRYKLYESGKSLGKP